LAVDRSSRPIRGDSKRHLAGARQTDRAVVNGERGPFVARKNDPVWAAISRFGTNVEARIAASVASAAQGAVTIPNPPPAQIPASHKSAAAQDA
jgi:hypothetical protein